MKKIILLFVVSALIAGTGFSQKQISIVKAQNKAQVIGDGFTVEKNNAATSVKNQDRTGTCWSFSTTSLLESQFLKNNNAADIDLSEMFTVYNIYIEKAKNYVLRGGKAQFSEGGLGHDVIRAVADYGAMPQVAYSGSREGDLALNHSKLVIGLKEYLDNILSAKPIPADWMDGFKKMLNEFMGTPPEEFEYNGKHYTPKSFAGEVLKFSNKDYVNITSFTHHPFYTPFILEVPDNFSNGSYNNIPLADMIQVVKTAINKGYTVLWDADVSNGGFIARSGLGLFIQRNDQESAVPITAEEKELPWDPKIRQQLFENLSTQDDHLMQITGIEKTKSGKLFFIVKNSWGVNGPYQGYINVSESYFAINTISLVVPKQAIDQSMLTKIGLK